MNAPQTLRKLYESWRELSESETAAIEAAAWDRLEEVQLAKARLQPEIIATTDHWHREAGRHSSAHTEPSFRSLVNELITLESRNSQLLADRMRDSRREIATLDRTTRTLNRVQKSYGNAAPTVWHSYS